MSARIAAANADRSSINSRKLGKGRHEITVKVRLPRRSPANGLLTSLTNLEGVEASTPPISRSSRALHV